MYSATSELTHLAYILKKHSKTHQNLTLKEIKGDILWHVSQGLFIYVKSGKEESIMMSRFLSDISDRIGLSNHDPYGDIVWIDFFYSSGPEAGAGCGIKAMEAWYPKKMIAFHRDYDNQSPHSYSMYPVRFCLKYTERLVRDLLKKDK